MAKDVAGDDDRPHLQCLPPELRNIILSLILVEDEPIEIKKGSWPGVLVSCKQLREEGIPVYFGNNTFTARITGIGATAPHGRSGRSVRHIRKFDTAALDAWLEVFQALPTEWKKLVESVTMHCDGELLDLSADYQSPTMRRYWRRDMPNFTFWHSLVSRFKDTGLTAQQLVWPGVTATGSTLDARIRAISLHMVNKHILTPVLADLEMLDPERPPVFVTDSIEDEISAAPWNSQERRRLRRLQADTNRADLCMGKETLQDWKAGRPSS